MHMIASCCSSRQCSTCQRPGYKQQAAVAARQMAVQPEELQRHNSARIVRKRGVQRRARNRQERIARSQRTSRCWILASRKRRKRLHFVAKTALVERSACEFVNNESLRKTAAIGAAYFTGQTEATALGPQARKRMPLVQGPALNPVFI